MKLLKASIVISAIPIASLIGLLGFKAALLESEDLQHHIVEKICAGTPHGILLAKAIYPTNHAHLNEEISSALSAALQFAPEQVLESFGTNVCLPPDHLPDGCVYRDWKFTSLQALTQVAKPELAEPVSKCRSLIENS